MAEEGQDQIIFVMATGGTRHHKSVAAGEGRAALEDIVRHDHHWIEVDDNKWIVRNNVLYAYVSAADEDRSPLIA